MEKLLKDGSTTEEDGEVVRLKGPDVTNHRIQFHPIEGDEWQTKNGSLERVTFTDGATEDDVFLEDNQASGAAIIRETPPPLIKPMEIPPVLSSTLNGINVSEQKICRNITAASEGLIVRSDISGNDSGPSSNVRERELAENSKNLIKSQKPISNETITTNVAPLQPSTTQIGPVVAFPRSLRTNRHGEGNKHGLRNQASRGSESPVSDLLAAILLLSAFTFCALCVPIVPEIFVVIVFVVSLFFQILMDLNAQ